MKYVIFLWIICFAVSCKAQNQEFNDYLASFKNLELPIKIDRKTYSSIFYQDGNYKEIPETWLKKFVSKDSLIYPIDPTEFRYDFGVRYNTNHDHIAVLVHKQKYEGTTVYDFDLSEVVLIIYSYNGEVLSQKIIGQDNDGWISNTNISEDKISVQQIKILEFNKTELACEIEEKEYLVNVDGIIILTETKPIKSGIVYWDKQLENFVLK